MCGLTGIASLDNQALPEGTAHVVRRMTTSLTRRGPDDFRLLGEEKVHLGFTRLSIVDPADGGQPLVSEDGSLVLIANGEIYNHAELERRLPSDVKLRTRSDCEVLLHLYARSGLAFLDDVRGMFALVLWDKKNHKLIFARDRFGIKPLFYTKNAERVSFASELKALFQDPSCPRTLDWPSALADQAVTSAPTFVSSPVATWFDGVEIVPAATIVSVDLDGGAVREHRYWTLPVPGADADSGRSAQDLIDEYRDLLVTAVRDCGMSDVEVGLFLSGGLDSAAVAGLTDRDIDLHTFTALTIGTFENGDAEHAARAAALLGRPNHQVLMSNLRVPAVEEWRRLLWTVETPLCNFEQYYKFQLHRYAKQERPGLRVMLTGQASDEFNGGYSATIGDGAGWDEFAGNLEWMSIQTMLGSASRFSSWWRTNGFAPLRPSFLRDHVERAVADPYAAFVRLKYRDIQQYNCWHEDRTAAGNGIEARVPFLDHRLVELTARIPPHMREELLWDKRILREAMRGLLPTELLSVPKVPFFFGDGINQTRRTMVRMLEQEDYRLVWEAMDGSRAADHVDPRALVNTLRRLHDNVTAAPVELVLRLVNLGLLEAQAKEAPDISAWDPPGPVPEALSIDDWVTGRDRVARLITTPFDPDLDTVFRFPDGVMVVQDVNDPDTRYFVVDGSVEFVATTEDEPWFRFAGEVDGRRSLREILSVLGVSPAHVRDQLAEAVEHGILVAATASVPAGKVS